MGVADYARTIENSHLNQLVFVLAYLAGLIYAAVQAYGNKMFKLPVVGNMAEKWTK